MSRQHQAHPTRESPQDPTALLDPDTHKPRGFPIWTTAAVIIVVGIVVSIVLSVLQQMGGVAQVAKAVGLTKTERSLRVVDARDTQVLISVNSSSNIEVRVVDAQSQNVEDVSKGALQARQPTFSRSGNQVAHFVTRGEKTELDVATLGGSSDTVVSSAQLTTLARQKSLDKVSICPWTAITWSTTDERLAFFLCTGDDSLVAVKDLDSGELSTLDSTRSTDPQARTLAWLSNEELAVVQSEQGLDAVWVVHVIPGQREQIYGP